MESIMSVVFMASGLVVIALTLSRSVARTKSSVKWLKGYNLKCRMTDEAVVELLNRISYPQKESVSVGTDGKVTLKTNRYEYPVEISADENGNTTIGLIINWAKVSKYKRKRLAFDWDNVYQFIQQEVEGVETVDAMKAYEKNMKMQKLLNIASIICLISALSFMFMG